MQTRLNIGEDEKMKEMEYKKYPGFYPIIGDIRWMDTLAHGTYKGYQFWIISFGTHPCAYVEIPEDHEYYGRGYEDMPLDVHGGLTFARDNLVYHEYSDKYGCCVRSRICDTWIVGWDYAHLGDYASYSPEMGGRRHSTTMIYNDVKYAINQLNGAERIILTGE